MRAGGIIGLTILMIGGGCGQAPEPDTPVFREIPAGHAWLGSRESPAHPPHEVRLPPFAMAETEVTVAQYALFLRATAGDPPPDHPALERAPGGWRARPAMTDLPMTNLRRSEAEDYAAWLGRRLGTPVRLPTEDEWEYAARGGVPGARWPWGWGDPRGRAHFDAAAVAHVRTGAVNPFGLRGMAGNVFEWCAGDGPHPDSIPARGGAWSERDPDMLCVFSRAGFSSDYAGADVGFRVLRDVAGYGEEVVDKEVISP